MISKASFPGAGENRGLANSLCSCQREGGGQVWGRGGVRGEEEQLGFGGSSSEILGTQ